MQNFIDASTDRAALMNLAAQTVAMRPQDAEAVFLYSCKCGFDVIVGVLIKCGVNINCTDRVSWSSGVQRAVLSKMTTMLRVLLNAGANPNTSDYMKVTPLHDAVQMGRADMVELLLSHGAVWVNKANPSGIPNGSRETALDLAMKLTNKNERGAIVAMLEDSRRKFISGVIGWKESDEKKTDLGENMVLRFFSAAWVSMSYDQRLEVARRFTRKEFEAMEKMYMSLEQNEGSYML